MLCLTLIFALVCTTQTVNSANILCLFGFASPSHFIWNHAIIEELAQHGHNLTVVSANVDKQNQYPDNVHYILLEAVYSKLYGGANAFDLMEFSENYALPAIVKIYDWKVTVCEGL
jgi:glucuronosyltransferase